MTVRNLQHLHNPVNPAEELTWAEARLRDMARLAEQHPGDMLYRIALASRQAEVDALKRRIGA